MDLCRTLVILAVAGAFTGCSGGVPSGGGGVSGISEECLTPNPRKTDVLIFNGAGTLESSAQAVASILEARGLNQKTVDSGAFNAMTLDELADYGVIIWPGGTAQTMTDNISQDAREKARRAVIERGVSFVGFCAGSFMAVGPSTPGTGRLKLGLGLMPGDLLDYYYLENQGVTAAMTELTFRSGSKRDMVWWGGPVLEGFRSGAIAKYRTGEVAMGQTCAGKGFVALSAVHPEAPQAWRDDLKLSDADGLDTDIAWDLIEAALNRRPLPVF